MTGPVAVLVGPPGAGKSTVGAALASTWGVPFRDTDEDVESSTGRTISDIFVDAGEDAFRALERAAVVAALAEHPGVLALGGGAVLDPRTQQDLAGRTVVFLDVSLADAAPRIGLTASRPLLAGNPRARWQELMAQRRGIYDAVATVSVSTDGLSPDEVTHRVLAALAEVGRGAR